MIISICVQNLPTCESGFRYISFKNFSEIWLLTKVQSLGNLMGSIFLYFLPLEASSRVYRKDMKNYAIAIMSALSKRKVRVWIMCYVICRVCINLLLHNDRSRAGSILRKECSSYSWDIPLLWKGGYEIFAFESVPYIFRGFKDKTSLFKHFSVLRL